MSIGDGWDLCEHSVKGISQQQGWAINLNRATLRGPCIAEGHTFWCKWKQVMVQDSCSVYCDNFEDISDLNVFVNASASQ